LRKSHVIDRKRGKLNVGKGSTGDSQPNRRQGTWTERERDSSLIGGGEKAFSA